MITRPILFSTEMVQGILSGSKIQTRRVIKPQPTLSQSSGFNWKGHSYGINSTYKGTIKNFVDCFNVCPYGMVGDQLFVQETYGTKIRSVGGTPHESFAYKADNPKEIAYYDCHGKGYPIRWKPSSRMPRKASRILLEITNISLEPLNSISDKDAKAEGVVPALQVWKPYPTSKRYSSSPELAFKLLWEEYKGSKSWAENPWVWVIEFKVIQGGAS